MLTILKTWAIRILIVLEFVLPANAELLLLKRSENGYYLIDSETFAKENSADQEEIREIFNEILMVYQWPMITVNYPNLGKDDREKYLTFLKKEHGATLFIQGILNDKYKSKYQVKFIPTTLFELAAINSYMTYVINYKAIDENGFESIFPVDDIRNGNNSEDAYFRAVFAKDISDTLRKHQTEPNANIIAMKIACDRYSKSFAIFDMFLQTSLYIQKNIVGDILPSDKLWDQLWGNSEHIKKTITSLVDLNEKNKTQYYDAVEKKESILKNKNYDKMNSRTFVDYISAVDIKTLVKGTEQDILAERRNEFILYRGTKGLNVKKNNEEKFIIDSPYRESVEDYREALKEWPDSLQSLKDEFLSIHIIDDVPRQNNKFQPYTLSFGNSLLAGTFHEASIGTGARALDYFRGGVGYALVFPISEFFAVETSGPSLQQKFVISALHPLAALFGKGEFFHSRNKISLFHPRKELSEIGKWGFNSKTKPEVEVLELDRAIHSGFFITYGIDWTTLHSSITQDIASHLILITQPLKGDATETQKNFGLFSSMEIAAFKDHFLKFQPVMTQLKNNPNQLRPSNKDERPQFSKDKRAAALQFGGKIQKYPIPESSPDNRDYKTNIFTKIIENPANQNTAPIVNTNFSLSFNDLRKRTKEHALIIPKGKYITFSHFTNSATPEEIKDLMVTMAATARKLGLDKTGYRIITNNSLSPGASQNNNANQEIGHFHIHLAGGECLGKPVVGANMDMTIDLHPFAADWTPEQFYIYANTNKIGERMFETREGKHRFLAYHIKEDNKAGVTQLIGFLVLNEKRQSVYSSIDDFSKHASADEMKALFSFMKDTAVYRGIYETGFRIISNFGNDAGQYPKNVFNFILAGGNLLGITVTNMYGNKTIWQGNNVLDYNYLSEYPHEHCTKNSYDTYELLEKMKTDVPLEYLKADKEFKWIYFSGKTLSEELLNVKNPELIRKISINANKIKILDENFDKFENLEEIDLSNNELTELSFKIFPYKLKKIDLGRNKLGAINGDIEKLKNLTYLSFSENDLQTIPDAVCNLSNLTTLNLSGNNRLTEIPDCFGKLTKLEELYLLETNIKSLPTSLLEVKSLKQISLDKNFPSEKKRDLTSQYRNIKFD